MLTTVKLAENNLPFALALMCFVACSESWKEIKGVSFFQVNLSPGCLHMLKRWREISWHGRNEAPCGLCVHQINPMQISSSSGERPRSGETLRPDFLFSLIPPLIFEITVCLRSAGRSSGFICSDKWKLKSWFGLIQFHGWNVLRQELKLFPYLLYLVNSHATSCQTRIQDQVLVPQ